MHWPSIQILHRVQIFFKIFFLKYFNRKISFSCPVIVISLSSAEGKSNMFTLSYERTKRSKGSLYTNLNSIKCHRGVSYLEELTYDSMINRVGWYLRCDKKYILATETIFFLSFLIHLLIINRLYNSFAATSFVYSIQITNNS